jgi:fibronectin type 3 domain-containing protein
MPGNRKIAIVGLVIAACVLSLTGGAGASGLLFNDGFESGNLGQWTASSGVVVQQQEAFSGAWAARATSTSGTAAWAYKSISPSLSELYVDSHFKVVSQANNNVSLVRLRTSTAGAIASVMRRNDGALLFYNEITGVSTAGPVASVGTWHDLEVHVLISGTTSHTDVWLDGTSVSSMTKTDNLGTNAVGRVYLGEPSSGRTFDVAFDDEIVSTSSDVSAPTTPTGLAASAVGSLRVNLSWNASSDNVGVSGYTIYRNGARLGTVDSSTTSFADATVVSGNTYAYSVDAYDGAGNHSPATSPVSLTAVSDIQVPTVPGTLTAIASDSSHVALQWSASTDNVSVVGYTVYRNGAELATVTGGTSYTDATVSPATTYTYTVDAYDAAANHSAASAPASATTPSATDSTPPGTPTDVTAAGSSNDVDLSWSASSDDVGVIGYTVYRNGSVLAVVAAPATAYADFAVSFGVSYSYSVDAFDAAGNHSAQSSPPVSGALVKPIPPDAPTALQASAASYQEVDLSWTAPADSVRVSGYVVYRDGAAIGTVTAPTTSFVDSTVAPSTTYSYTIDAFDGGGNHSAQSAPVAAATPAPPDLTPPSVPAQPIAVASSPMRIDLNWSASTDGVGVTGYTIYRGGTQVATVSGSSMSFSDTTLSPNTAYSYAVDAFDAAGNHSARSATAAATTPPIPDLTPPTTPTSFAVKVVNAGKIDLSWSASTDNVGVVGYTIYRGGSVLSNIGAGSTSFADVIVVGAATYSYAVDAFDAAGNHSPKSNTVTASTPGTVFSDGFETGNMTRWTTSSGITIQSQQVYSGTSAARATTTNGNAYAYKALSPALGDLYFDTRFKFVSQASGNDSVVRLRTATAGAILSILRRTDGNLLYYNEVTGTTTVGPNARLGAWHELEVHVQIAGASSQIDVWLDGARIVGKTDSLGTTSVGRVYIGDPGTGRAFDLVIDDALVSTSPDVTAPTVPGNVSATTIGATHVNVTWTASTDNQALHGYTIYRNGVAIASAGPASTGYADTAAPASATSTYTVDAVDASGNRSALSATATATTPAASPADPTIAAAGDIACDPADVSFAGGVGTATACRQGRTSDLLFDANLAAVLPLGDLQYEDATLAKFFGSYDQSWGRLQSIVRPVPGNHEYLTPGAAGYFAYFGAAAGDASKGYYSYNIGTWHIIALNSECANTGGCGIGSPEETWLRNDLAQSTARCTLAYWHEPRFSSGFHGNDARTSIFWSDLYAAGADIVLNGHDHNYERFAPQTPDGVAAPEGIREFVVGTGGAEHEPPGTLQPNSEAYDGSVFGVLELTLHPTGYDWNLVPASGDTFTDAGNGTCH